MRGLYVHLPFCNAKCPYCAFYSVTDADDNVISRYLDTCLKDIDSYDNKSFDTIYFGGGTPSIIPVHLLDNFIDSLMDNINYSGKEFTIEANPDSVSDDFISVVKNSPITRVSLGVQSLNDDVLKLLGRIHDSKKAIKSAEQLSLINIDLNLDMIFDIPNIDSKIIFSTADTIASLSPSHVSAYSYSSEDRGYLEGFDNDDTQFEDIENFFASKGIYKYETSNFAKTGYESKHNIIYWTMDEYVGIGSASHSMVYLDDDSYVRYSKPNNVDSYINDFIINDNYDILGSDIAIKEALTLGLRMKQGVNIIDIEQRFSALPEPLTNAINMLVEQEVLEWDSNYIKTTQRGSLGLEYLSQYLWRA